MKVFLGLTNISDPSRNYEESRIVTHIECNNRSACLLKLSGPVNFTDSIYPVHLAAAGSALHSGLESWVMSGSPSGTSEEVQIVGHSECKCVNPGLAENMICAGPHEHIMGQDGQLHQCLDRLYPVTRPRYITVISVGDSSVVFLKNFQYRVKSNTCGSTDGPVCALELSPPVILFGPIPPICVAAEGSTYSIGMETFVPHGVETGNVKIQVAGNDECRSSGVRISEEEICAGPKERNMSEAEQCRDNSGHSLSTRVNSTWVLIGIVQPDLGSSCPRDKVLASYSDVSKVQESIRNQVEGPIGFVTVQPTTIPDKTITTIPPTTATPELITTFPSTTTFASDDFDDLFSPTAIPPEAITTIPPTAIPPEPITTIPPIVIPPEPITTIPPTTTTFASDDFDDLFSPTAIPPEPITTTPPPTTTTTTQTTPIYDPYYIIYGPTVAQTTATYAYDYYSDLYPDIPIIPEVTTTTHGHDDYSDFYPYETTTTEPTAIAPTTIAPTKPEDVFDDAVASGSRSFVSAGGSVEPIWREEMKENKKNLVIAQCEE
ncbi:tryptase gamma-like isoform X4 [Xyrichtys novacula]|uniref:Tryptase gamma-like isoform X4 n=1 Tax=Xyrichtys novacula TaxID=13765 RepID=A0AAV1HM16_XYRNO|nr:tryptase gamma-like isoform X4 [Xyrichtys novacula]